MCHDHKIKPAVVMMGETVGAATVGISVEAYFLFRAQSSWPLEEAGQQNFCLQLRYMLRLLLFRLL